MLLCVREGRSRMLRPFPRPGEFSMDISGDLADWTAVQRNGIGLEVTITSRNGVVSQEEITTEVGDIQDTGGAVKSAGVVK